MAAASCWLTEEVTDTTAVSTSLATINDASLLFTILVCVFKTINKRPLISDSHLSNDPSCNVTFYFLADYMCTVSAVCWTFLVYTLKTNTNLLVAAAEVVKIEDTTLIAA
jgi:hypothetical protein